MCNLDFYTGARTKTNVQFPGDRTSLGTVEHSQAVQTLPNSISSMRKGNRGGGQRPSNGQTPRVALCLAVRIHRIVSGHPIYMMSSIILLLPPASCRISGRVPPTVPKLQQV